MNRELLSDLAKYVPARAIPALVGIVSIPIVTRLFPPHDYGNYSLVAASVSVLAVLAGWVNIMVGRFFPAHAQEGTARGFGRLIARCALLWAAALSLATLLALVSLKKLIPGDLFRLGLVGIAVFALSFFFDVLLDFLRIRRLIFWYNVFFIWQKAGSLLLGVGLVIVFRLGVSGLLWGTAAAAALALVPLRSVALGGLAPGERSPPRGRRGEMARYAFPLVAANLAAWLLSLSDRYVLEYFRGAGEVGLYSVSYRLGENSMLALITLFALAFDPIAITIWEREGEEASRRFLYQGARYYLLLGVPAVVALSLLRAPLIRVLSTPAYYEGASVVPWVALSIFALGLVQRFGTGLTFHKKTVLSMSCFLLAGGANLLLNFLLIPRWGYRGAAAATLLSYLFFLGLMIPASRRYFTWPFPFASGARAAGAAGAMGAVLLLLPRLLRAGDLLTLLASAGAGGGAYLAALLLLKEIKPRTLGRP